MNEYKIYMKRENFLLMIIKTGVTTTVSEHKWTNEDILVTDS